MMLIPGLKGFTTGRRECLQISRLDLKTIHGNLGSLAINNGGLSIENGGLKHEHMLFYE